MLPLITGQERYRQFHYAVIEALRDKTSQVLTELADRDATSGKVYMAYRKFSRQVIGWTTVSEYGFLKACKSGQ